ncbi:MAG: hypothetical protein M3R00_05500 [Pseudomonadota bacterium]|nr:hypothetical protein [Pseudomonadota bacterium]
MQVKKRELVVFEKTIENQAAMTLFNVWRAKKFQRSANIDSMANLTSINQQLDEREIDISISANPPLVSRRDIDMRAAQQTIDRLASPAHAEVLKEFLQTRVMHITMPHFMQALNECCMQFNYWLMNNPEFQDYTVLYQNGRSQQWVTSLALRYLYILPRYDQKFQLTGLQSLKSIHQHPERKTYVLFDDHAISGSQLCEQVLGRFYEVLDEKKSNEKYRLIIITPFMTTKAYKKVTSAAEGSYRDVMDVKIITSRIIPSINQLVLNDERKTILQEIFWRDETFAKSVMYTDWKLPDIESIPGIFLGEVSSAIDKYAGKPLGQVPPSVSMLPDTKPPYKSSKMRLYYGNPDAQGLFFRDHTYTRRSIAEFQDANEMRKHVASRDFVYL